MDDVVIETGVPIPVRTGFTQTLRTMNVGDSFLVADDKLRKNVLIRASQLKCDPPRKFTSRAMPDGGYRIWRIA